MLAAPGARAEEIDRIVLRVNDEIATLADYAGRRSTRITAISRSQDLPAEQRQQMIDEAGRSAMREMFEELLVLSRAHQLRLEASPSEIDRALENAKRRFGVSSDEELEQGLAQQGSSMAEFRARMAQNLLFNEVLQREIQPRIKVDDEEVARYWREHPEQYAVAERRKVEELVVRETASPSIAERRALAVALRDLLVEGKSIADAVAAQKAADKTLVLDHDWIERGTLDPQLETTVWELDTGGVGGPIEGRGGFHVLKLGGIEPAKVRPLETVRGEITQTIQESRYEAESAKYLDELASKAYVVENVPPDAVGYRSAPSGQRDPVRELMRGEAAQKSAEAPAEGAAPAEPLPPAKKPPAR